MDIYGFLKTASAYKAFKKDYDSGKCAHAYILHCKDSLTADNMLKLFAAVLLCKSGEAPCLKCSVCARIIKGVHPDCRSYPLKEGKILVEDIDDLTENAGYRPCEGDTKVFLLLDGDTMNAASQNKLLKTLEEPPQSVYILIGTANTESLLSTVKSRCRLIDCGSFTEGEIYNFLIGSGCNDRKASVLARHSGGSLGRALNMMSNESYINMYNYVYGLFGRLSFDDVPSCMNVINAYEDKEDILYVMQMCFRDAMVNAVNGNKGICGVKSLIYLIEKTAEAKRKLAQNCNKTAVFETLLNDMVSAGKEELH